LNGKENCNDNFDFDKFVSGSFAHLCRLQKEISIRFSGTEQTICPVLNAPIDKNIYVEYQGKKVYFCCADCKAAFEKEPAKYISKLPQFAK
jgi:YHS domain-containing protein